MTDQKPPGSESENSGAVKNISSALRISEQIYNERLQQANNEKAQALQESQVSTSAPINRTTQPAPQKIMPFVYPEYSDQYLLTLRLLTFQST
ncbi:hypothetical protein [Endozoicomonas sp. SCSIO W0465]|uniref:hypothetical protein n=1 Tax=Endozoicomonas sp. SCSIO W0465 TaxID=2918516 RepID=UPI002075D245|nr:hypothetical protein [Endozoicomonas sp. SCSIO W0465]USE38721.1 hypothetical protein MJO57_11425 [Endozoicomonas sp. SCSIO W0465]